MIKIAPSSVYSVLFSADLITEQLPKLKEKLNFRQFAGYVDVSEQKSLFYWFVGILFFSKIGYK